MTMTSPNEFPKKSDVDAADRAMQSRRFGEAIALYEQRLTVVPTDLAALLKLGICHLLNRSERRFLEIHAQAQSLRAALPSVPAEVNALWRKYEGLAVKVTAGAMVIGGLAMAGCSQPVENAGTPASPTQKPTAPGVATSAAPVRPVSPPVSSHRYSGGVYIPAIPNDAMQPPTNKPSTSSHKYSGGVYLKPKPESNDAS